MSYISRISDAKEYKFDETYWVKMKTRVSFERARELAGNDDERIDQLGTLAEVITEWNIDNDEGVLPITKENVGKLEAKHVTMLMQALTEEVTASSKKE